MKISKYYNQGEQGGNLPTEYGTYSSPFITEDVAKKRYRKPGPPLMLRGRHRHRTQPRPVGVQSMTEAYPPSRVPTGFTYAGGSLSGNLFSDVPYTDDLAETPGYGAVGNYEQGNPGAPDAVQNDLGYTYAGPAALAQKVKAFFVKPLVLAVLLGVGGYILYSLFVRLRLQPNPGSSRHSWERYSRKKTKRRSARNKSLSTHARGRARNADGTFKKAGK